RSTSEVILELKELTFNEYEYSYSYRTSALLNKISISLYKGCSYALIGDNGVGKSTLSKIIFRLVTPDSGQVLLCNQSISLYTRADISDIVCYIGQFPEQQIIFSNIGLYIRNAEKKNNTFSSSIMKKWLNLLIVCHNTNLIRALSAQTLRLSNGQLSLQIQ